MSTTENIAINSESCGYTSQLNPPSPLINTPLIPLPRDTFYEVSQLCDAQLAQSSCNGGSLPGFQVHIYRDTITLPASCTDWVVSWSSCCRNNAITNLVNPSGSGFYIEAGINSTICNSSPTFTSNPTPYFCAGQCYNYSHGAFDPENDSLRYAMTCPLDGNATGPNTCISHIAGLSSTQPLVTNPGDFVLDSLTGQMSFCTDSTLNQFAVAAVTVFQIVNGDTIGYVQRDIQMVVLAGINCTTPVGSNNPIVDRGGAFDDTTNTFIVCSGDTLIFSLILTDPDGDTISIDNANTNLAQVFGAGNFTTILNNFSLGFRHDSAKLSILVTAIPSNIGVNNFTIGITDNACPVPGNQILSYNLIIPGVEVTASDTTICPGIAQQVQMTANSFSTVGALAAGTFQWQQLSGPPITFSDTTDPNPLINVPANTVDGDVIVLQVTFVTDTVNGQLCTTTDQVSIYLRALPLDLNIFASDTSLCPNNQLDTISFSSSIFGPGIDLVNGVYSWTANPSSYLSDLTNTTINNPDAHLSGGLNNEVTYTINYTYGLCVGEDSVKIRFDASPPVTTLGDTTVCPGDTITVTALYGNGVPSIVNDSLLTQFTGGNGQSGIMFDITATNAVTITGFQADVDNPGNFEIYYKAGTHVGFEGNAAAWTLAGTAIGVPNNPTGTPTPIPITLNVPMGAGQTYGFYVTFSNSTNLNYSNGTAVGNVHASDANIQVREGTGKGYPFAGSFAPRVFNGVVEYSVGTSVVSDFQWTPSVGFLNNSDTLDIGTVIPQSNTTYIIYANNGECTMWDSVLVSVNSTIPAPTVSCGTPANEATAVLFEWGSSPGATAWEYSLDSGTTWIPRPLADSTLLVTGLTNGDCVGILVRAVGGAGPCPTNAATYLECCTTPCPMPTTSTITNLRCFGSADGTMTINISGGVLGDHPSYTATLFDTSGAQIGTPLSTPVTSPSSVVFNGLSAGVYYAYLTDTFGCFTNSDTLVITQPDTLIAALGSTTLTTCFGDADGTATVLATGGTATYSYLWDNAANSQTTATAINLSRGTYNVTVTDAEGCTDETSIVVNSPFPALPAIIVNTTPSGSCIGDGTATVFSTFNMVGNGNNYTYAWSNSASTGSIATGLPSGPTTVTVIDTNGCQAISTVTITGSPTISVTSMPVINPGCGTTTGQITAVVTGDSTGYTYQWSPNASGQTTGLVTGLGIGTYMVTATGNTNGCTAIGTVALVNNSALNIVGFNVNDPSCGGSNGDITVLTIGAVGTLTFNWEDAGGTNVGSTNPATGLPAGLYRVTVNDPSTGCSDIGDSILVEPALAATIFNPMNPSCNLANGSLTVTATGAPGPFTYLWSTGETNATAIGLVEGVAYTCDVTFEGCTETVGPITLTSDSLHIAITDKDDITCNGDFASYANLTLITGDPSTTTFAWSNGASTQNISGMGPGTYTVTATSGTCTATQSLTVVDVTLTTNAWVGQTGDKTATIQLTTPIDIDGGVGTNHANPVYSWTESNSTIVDITDPTLAATIATGAKGGDVWLTLNATAGPCTAVDSILITVESYLGMPTAFTPNGDGINDLFRPAGLKMSDKVLQFKIYNRWGQLVYSDNVNHFWDGTYQGVAQAQDVYIYVFEYAPQGEDPVYIRGEFTLMR